MNQLKYAVLFALSFFVAQPVFSSASSSSSQEATVARQADTAPKAAVASSEEKAAAEKTGKVRKKRKAQGRQIEIFAISALVLSIAGAFSFYYIAGLVFSLLAAIAGLISLVRIRENRDKYAGKGFAIAGLIIGVLGVASFVIYGLSNGRFY
ncbi:hypothetical protein GCM10023189_46390 [Nibrella saemangeumensis]|uniref:DUF4190 domain-containing protein n=1 Tax=Nibrella saemangeumensis TaxID=1084526 RepID=A0ABP8NHM8_9BACT